MHIRPSTDLETGRTGVWIEKQTNTERLAYRHCGGDLHEERDCLFISMDRDAWVQLLNAVADTLGLSTAQHETPTLRSVPAHLDETTETWMPDSVELHVEDRLSIDSVTRLLGTVQAAWSNQVEDLIGRLVEDRHIPDDQASHPFTGWTREMVHEAAKQSRLWEHEQAAAADEPTPQGPTQPCIGGQGCTMPVWVDPDGQPHDPAIED